MIFMIGIEIEDDDSIDVDHIINTLKTNIGKNRNVEVHKQSDRDCGQVVAIKVDKPTEKSEYSSAGIALQLMRDVLIHHNDAYEPWLVPSIRFNRYIGPPANQIDAELFARQSYPYDYEEQKQQHDQHLTIDIRLPEGCQSENFLDFIYNNSPNLFENPDLIQFFYAQTWFSREDNALINLDLSESNLEQRESQMDALNTIIESMDEFFEY